MTTERDPKTPAEIFDVVESSDLSEIAKRSLESVGVRTQHVEDAFNNCLREFRDESKILAIGIIPIQTHLRPMINFVVFLEDLDGPALLNLEKGNALKAHVNFANALRPTATSGISISSLNTVGLEKFASAYATNYQNSQISFCRFPDKVSPNPADPVSELSL